MSQVDFESPAPRQAFAVSLFGALFLVLLAGGLCFALVRVLGSETEGFRALFVGLAPVPGALLAWIAAFCTRRWSGVMAATAPLGVFLFLGVAPWLMMLRRVDSLGQFLGFF